MPFDRGTVFYNLVYWMLTVFAFNKSDRAAVLRGLSGEWQMFGVPRSEERSINK